MNEFYNIKNGVFFGFNKKLIADNPMWWSPIKPNGYYIIPKFREVKIIGDSAFKDDTLISSIVIPEGVTEIQENAFENCINLKKVDLPKSLRVIKKRAFANCNSLTDIFLPAGVEFDTTSFDKHTVINYNNDFIIQANKIEQYLGIESNVVIPEGVQETADVFGSYLNTDSIKSIIFPKSMRRIYGFSELSNLESVYFNEGLIEIGSDAFYNCPKLKQINRFPYSLETIGDSAFFDCYNLTGDLVFNCKQIGYAAFLNCRSIDSVLLNNTIIVSSYAFAFCSDLSVVHISRTVKQVEEGAFHDCINIDALVVESNTTNIDNAVFNGKEFNSQFPEDYPPIIYLSDLSKWEE